MLSPIIIMYQLIRWLKHQILPNIIIPSPIPSGISSYPSLKPHLHSLQLCLVCKSKCPCLAAVQETWNELTQQNFSKVTFLTLFRKVSNLFKENSLDKFEWTNKIWKTHKNNLLVVFLNNSDSTIRIYKIHFKFIASNTWTGYQNISTSVLN